MAIGLALSGGGAKGAAHIGVLQALKDEGINIDYISGTSSGSIVATLFACGYNPYSILYMFNTYYKHISEYDKKIPLKILGMLVSGKLTLKSLVKSTNIEMVVRDFCKKKDVVDIRDIKMPIAIPTVDLNTGEIVYFSNTVVNESYGRNALRLYDDSPAYKYSGDIANIVRASSSFPAVFEPKLIDGRLLVDGGVRVNSPVSILRQMGADKVIAVSFDDNINDYPTFPNIITVTAKSFDIMGHQLNKSELEKADLVLRPKVKNMSLLDGDKSNYCATQGYKVVKSNIEDIKMLLK